MTSTRSSHDADDHHWLAILSQYTSPNDVRSVAELAISLLGLGALLGAVWASETNQHWVALALAPLGIGFLARLFVIFHDCTHGSFFRSRLNNVLIGRALGVLLLTPYTFWRETHLQHHASAGDLDRRGSGDIDTLTVDEYRQRSWPARTWYRATRHPFVLFGVAPLYQFGLRHRLPVALPQPRSLLTSSIVMNDICLLAAVLLLGHTVGWQALLWVAPWWLGMATLAVWFFYVHHQFEDTWWAHAERWRFAEAQLRNSAFIDLPPLFAWFTGNIGIHHVHHLSPRIPGYRLPEVLRDHPALARVNRIGLRDTLRCLPLALWDERRQRLVSFRDVAG